MKTTNQFLILVIILFSFSINSCKNKKNAKIVKTITITLYVDTDNIDQQNESSVSISNFGQSADIPNKDFTTMVNKGDEITWIGVSSSSPNTDEVRIKKIKHEDGKELLNKKEIIGEIKVKGKVKNGKKGDIEEYSIQFTVFNNGIKRNGNFEIDPKIQVQE